MTTEDEILKIAREACAKVEERFGLSAEHIRSGKLDNSLAMVWATLGARAIAAHLAAGAEAENELAACHECGAPAVKVKTPSVDDLAQEIRRVDGNHSLGAGALAEALMPFICSALCDDAGAAPLTMQVAHDPRYPSSCSSTKTVEGTLYNATPAPASDDLVERVRGLRIHIEALGIGCCTCCTKSPDAHWHAVECKVHNLAHALYNLDVVDARITSDAATIATLRAEVEQLTDEVSHQLGKRREQYDRATAAEAERDALKAEVARKDAALRVADLILTKVSGAVVVTEEHRVVRAALAPVHGSEERSDDN